MRTSLYHLRVGPHLDHFVVIVDFWMFIGMFVSVPVDLCRSLRIYCLLCCVFKYGICSRLFIVTIETTLQLRITAMEGCCWLVWTPSVLGISNYGIFQWRNLSPSVQIVTGWQPATLWCPCWVCMMKFLANDLFFPYGVQRNFTMSWKPPCGVYAQFVPNLWAVVDRWRLYRGWI